jgi:hypothetical protein
VKRLIAALAVVSLLLAPLADRALVYVLSLRAFERGDAIELKVDQQPPGLHFKTGDSRTPLTHTGGNDAEKHTLESEEIHDRGPRTACGRSSLRVNGTNP